MAHEADRIYLVSGGCRWTPFQLSRSEWDELLRPWIQFDRVTQPAITV